jgi:SOUL heme-binding protein
MVKILAMAVVLFLGVAILAGCGLLVVGCSLRRPAPQAGTSSNSESAATADFSDRAATVTSASQPAVLRVAGDLQAMTEFVNGEFRSGDCRIPTPLPDGYPTPTPPGAIELKRYPLVRRAEIGGTIAPDWGMNFAFFPLFNHINRREIAMTSPVEMNYDGLGAEGSENPSSWTMSFVYRTSELGAAGIDPKDERILIEDIPPVTVVAIGMRGPYKLKRVNDCISQLREWLSLQSQWEAHGEPRALFYNGPEARSSDLWSEVQVPVRPQQPD